MFCLINTRIISVKIGLFGQKLAFITEIPGGNFLLPTFLTGDKSDFQEANLLLATVNFEPWVFENNSETPARRGKKDDFRIISLIIPLKCMLRPITRTVSQ